MGETGTGILLCGAAIVVGLISAAPTVKEGIGYEKPLYVDKTDHGVTVVAYIKEGKDEPTIETFTDVRFFESTNVMLKVTSMTNFYNRSIGKSYKPVVKED